MEIINPRTNPLLEPEDLALLPKNISSAVKLTRQPSINSRGEEYTRQKLDELGLHLPDVLQHTDNQVKVLRGLGALIPNYVWVLYPKSALDGDQIKRASQRQQDRQNLVPEEYLLAQMTDVIEPSCDETTLERTNTSRAVSEYYDTDKTIQRAQNSNNPYILRDVNDMDFVHGHNRATTDFVPQQWMVDTDPYLADITHAIS